MRSRRGVRAAGGRWQSSAIAVVIALVVGACGGNNASDLPIGPVKDADMSLTAHNESNRALELYVNDIKIADVAATSLETIVAQDLPPLPWNASLRLTTGRALVSLTVTSGSVVITANGSQSVGARADLSCGRVELYVIAPILGPAPGTGRPGDCGP